MFEKLENYLSAGKSILYYVNCEIESTQEAIRTCREHIDNGDDLDYYKSTLVMHQQRLSAYEEIKQAIAKVVKSAV